MTLTTHYPCHQGVKPATFEADDVLVIHEQHQASVNAGRKWRKICIAGPLVVTGGLLFTCSQGYISEAHHEWSVRRNVIGFILAVVGLALLIVGLSVMKKHTERQSLPQDI